MDDNLTEDNNQTGPLPDLSGFDGVEGLEGLDEMLAPEAPDAPDAPAEVDETVTLAGAPAAAAATQALTPNETMEFEQVAEKGGSHSKDPAKRKKSRKRRRRIARGPIIAAAVAGLAVGVFLGAVIFGRGCSVGAETVPESGLDRPIAVYTIDGSAHQLSVRDVITQTSSLEAAADAEGNYRLPSAENVLSIARNKVVVAEAERRGIEVTEKDIAAYAETQLGTSDYNAIAESYNMAPDSVAVILKESCLMAKLREEVLADAADAGLAPEAPVAPTDKQLSKTDPETGETVEVDKLAVASPEYAAYIIALAGDEWDAEKGTWAATDGPFAKALAGYKITADSATYEAANTAYYVAYQLYSEQTGNTADAWTSFVNSLLAKAGINIYTLLT